MRDKEIRLLSHGLFEKPFMDSKVTSRSVSTKEKILGHLVGPLGLILWSTRSRHWLKSSLPSRPVPCMAPQMQTWS